MRSVSLPAATAPRRGKAGKPRTEQRDRRRLGCRDFGDHDLAVAGLQIGEQDLVDAGVEGAAAATGSRAVISTATATTAITATTTTAATGEATTTAAASEAALPAA